MITELTQEQKDAMPRYVKKWIDIGTATNRLSYDETVDIIHNVQEKLLKTKKTPVVIVNNPIEAWIACNYVKEGAKPNELLKKVDEYFENKKNGKKNIQLESFSMPYLNGSFDAAVFSFYDYFRAEVGIDYKEVNENYDIWQSTSKIGLIFPFDDVVIVSQKPTTIKLNEQNQAHCDGGPAIEYAGHGDIKIYMLNGVRVPEWLAVTHSQKIDLSRYNEIKNADVKTEFIRKVGIERMLDFGKHIDSHKNYKNEWWTKSQYELYDMSKLFEGVAYAPHVKMLNQTTKVWHVEAVSPDCKNLADAIKERQNGEELDIQVIA